MDRQQNQAERFWQARLARVLYGPQAHAVFRLALRVAIILALGTLASAQKKSSCIECHAKLDDPRISAPAKLFDNDIHRGRGLSCNDCHGGDPNADTKESAKDPGKGYLGKPKTADIPAYCGKCHSDANLMKRFNPSLRVDQEREYYSSVHGKLLKTGEQRVATCTSCHSVHGIRAISDPLSSVYPSNVAETCAKCHASADYMSGFGIPSDQFAKYKMSVHAKMLYEKQDLSAPTCNDCHGNHGATPPGLVSVANICGQCHARQAELFQTSPHKAAFDEREFSECVKCHSNHAIAKPSDQMIGTFQGALCVNCHTTGDKGFVAAGQMRARIDELIAGIDKSSEILGRAERAGMEVSRPKFEMKEATDALTHVRVLIHSLSPAEVDKVAAPGLAASARGYQAGLDALAERAFRRKGLAVSLVFILFLAMLVYLKVKQIESGQAQALSLSDVPGVDRQDFEEWKKTTVRLRNAVWLGFLVFATGLFTVPVIGGFIGWMLPAIFWACYMFIVCRPLSRRERELVTFMRVDRATLRRLLQK